MTSTAPAQRVGRRDFLHGNWSDTTQPPGAAFEIASILVQARPERLDEVANAIEALPDGSGDRLKQISLLEIINDDMPFLVDSVLDELADKGVDFQLVAHPVVSLVRDEAGRVVAFGDSPSAPGKPTRESVIHIHIARIDDEARRAEIVQGIAQVLAEVRVCVHDWRAMIDRVQQLIASLKSNPPARCGRADAAEPQAVRFVAEIQGLAVRPRRGESSLNPRAPATRTGGVWAATSSPRFVG